MDKGLNIHEFVVPDSYEEFLKVLENYNFTCTIRSDNQRKNLILPFYIITEENNSLFRTIWEISLLNNDKLIVTNGLKYDKLQSYNIVVKFDLNGDFIFEASSKKVPLRTMYKYPEYLLSAYGNIDDRLGDWKVIHEVYGLDRRMLYNDLYKLYELRLFNRYLECTFYPIEVGIYKKDYVIWQIVS